MIIIIAAEPQLVNISNLSGSNNRTLLNEDTNDPTTVNIDIPLHTHHDAMPYSDNLQRKYEALG